MKRVPLGLIFGAFAVLTVLIAAQTVHSIYQLLETQARIKTIVALHNKKIDTITRTQVAAHMRTDRLFYMFLETDPFRRDELYLDFNRAGFQVGSGRAELRKLGLNATEQKIFDAQTDVILKIESFQEQLVDLINQEQHEQARTLLITQAIPEQEHLNALLANLRGAVQKENEEALSETRLEHRKSLLITLISGSLATMLGLGLGWFTSSRIVASRRLIQAQLLELEASRATLQIEATHDPLTGLANRRLFYDRLRQALIRARRYQNKVGVLFVDLDRFKSVNDLYGHQTGDALLMEVASRLTKSVRASDTVARSGGDEFMVLLDTLHEARDCESIIGQVRNALAESMDLKGIQIRLGASIGHAIYPDQGDNEDDLVRAADAMMYKNKMRTYKMG